MEKYCTTLGKSKELEANAWKKETEFWWTPLNINNKRIKWMLFNNEEKVNEQEKYSPGIEYHPAPLAAEILEELNNSIIIQYANEHDEWTEGQLIDLFRVPDALADCWIWAKKNGLVKEEK